MLPALPPSPFGLDSGGISTNLFQQRRYRSLPHNPRRQITLLAQHSLLPWSRYLPKRRPRQSEDAQPMSCLRLNTIEVILTNSFVLLTPFTEFATSPTMPAEPEASGVLVRVESGLGADFREAQRKLSIRCAQLVLSQLFQLAPRTDCGWRLVRRRPLA